MNIRQLITHLGLLTLIISCAEPIDLGDIESRVCRPADPQCADEDYDGDGVKNKDDDFPADSACSVRDRNNCAECGIGCISDERCTENGACVPIEREVCNGEDDNGDGQVDEPEALVEEAPLSSKQSGVCAGARQVCEGGEWTDPPLPSMSERYEASETLCDGVDNDCDGELDEALTPPAADRQSGPCAGALKVCLGGQGWVEPNYSEREGYEAEETTCDGVDSDCDGQVDEALSAPLASVQSGVCAGGRKLCAQGAWVNPSLDSFPGYGPDVVCDGIDSDCDGQADEESAPPLADRQEGVCEGQRKSCRGAQGWVEPSYAELEGYEEAETSCDGVDSDCDGQVDEALAAPLAQNQRGACVGATQVCREGQWREPDLMTLEGFAPDSECDGVDSDCDGVADEDAVAPLADRQEGVCQGAVKECGGARGWLEPRYADLQQYETSETACDGVDSDCDGRVDEVLTAPLAQNQSGVCAGGRQLCDQGRWVDPALDSVAGFAPDTTCDGVDSDCDGLVDESVIPPPSDVQAGICAGSVKLCAGVTGWVEPRYSDLERYEVTETECDGVDTDCDGRVDEALTAPLAQNQFGVCAGGRQLCDQGRWVAPALSGFNGYGSRGRHGLLERREVEARVGDERRDQA